MKKKGLWIGLGVIGALLIVGVITVIILLSPVSKSNANVTFVVNSGERKDVIVSNLKDANLIRSKYVTLFYIVISGNNNLQAGSYGFSRDMSTKDIIKSLANGEVIRQDKETVNITFPEGFTLKKDLELICNTLGLDYDDALNKINDFSYLQELISSYDFLTDDILDEDIYYPLEGYLYPETYNFYTDSSIEDVIKRILDVSNSKFKNILSMVEDSGYSMHEVLTMASIVEKEALNEEDRRSVAQVIYTRLDEGMSLGMDVTAYYGVQKDYKDDDGNKVELSFADLNDVNPYNTRSTLVGLPAGPICNPSLESIEAVLNPSDTNYKYFYADSDGNVHFTESYDEFLEFKRIYG